MRPPESAATLSASASASPPPPPPRRCHVRYHDGGYTVEVFGVEGVLEAHVGEQPPAVEVFDVQGVLEAHVGD